MKTLWNILNMPVELPTWLILVVFVGAILSFGDMDWTDRVLTIAFAFVGIYLLRVWNRSRTA